MKFCCFCSLGWRPNGGRFRGPSWRGWRQSSQQAASSEASVRPVPDQNRAASFIQAVVRGNKVRAAIKALMAQKQSQREEEQIREKYEHETPQEHKQSEDAALKIQSIFRGHHSREEVAELRVEVRTTTRATTRTKSINEREVLRQINDYSVSALLGKGSFGIVYKAKHAPTKQVRAIKVLTRSVLRRKRMGKGTAYDSVLREIVVMKHIWHPNVVRLFEVIDDPEHDELYLVMEFVDGGDLLEPIKKKKFTNEDTLRRWMRDSVMGLEHLHNSGVCHRDIKPENILWDKKAKRAKLADFGVSTLCGQGRAGDYVKASHGTPLFFAPEMSGDDKTGARVYSGKAADCWALGVCLYMWMYLKAPFEAPTVHMLLELIRESEVVYPTHVYKASDSLMELLRGLLQQKPIQRLRVKDMRCAFSRTHSRPHPAMRLSTPRSRPCNPTGETTSSPILARKSCRLTRISQRARWRGTS